MLPALRPLIDKAAGPDALTPDLAAWYGGPLPLPTPDSRPFVAGNFVQALDGIVATREPGPEPLFGDVHDRMLMSVLRAWADVVVVGRRTFDRGLHTATWGWRTTAPKQVPWAMASLEEFADSLGRRPPHGQMIVSRSGRGLDYTRAIFHDPAIAAIVLTTAAGAARARGEAEAMTPAPQVDVWEFDRNGDIDWNAALTRFADAGRRRVLVEGGPSLYGALEQRGLIDELFLTTRGVVGGGGGTVASFSGATYEPAARPQLDLVSLRAAEDGPLFSRWRYRR